MEMERPEAGEKSRQLAPEAVAVVMDAVMATQEVETMEMVEMPEGATVKGQVATEEGAEREVNALAAVEVAQEKVVVALVREDQGKVANVASLGPAEVGTAAVRWAAEAGERRSRSSHHQTHNLNTWSLRHRHRTQSPH